MTPASHPSSPFRRVLVVEDHPDARQSPRLLLEVWGHQVEVAPDGLRGVLVALAWKPEVAIVDIGLPLLDGYEVARRLRAAFDVTILLIALTAYRTPEDIRRAHEAGFDIHLAKPADPGEIRHLLASA
jgi:CheY-like chemotaxis protein